MNRQLKNANIPGFDGTNLNVYQVRDYLMTQPDPVGSFIKLKKRGIISNKLEKAVVIELQRIGFHLDDIIIL